MRAKLVSWILFASLVAAVPLNVGAARDQSFAGAGVLDVWVTDGSGTSVCQNLVSVVFALAGADFSLSQVVAPGVPDARCAIVAPTVSNTFSNRAPEASDACLVGVQTRPDVLSVDRNAYTITNVYDLCDGGQQYQTTRLELHEGPPGSILFDQGIYNAGSPTVLDVQIQGVLASTPASFDGVSPGNELEPGFLTPEEGEVAYDTVRLSAYVPPQWLSNIDSVAFWETIQDPVTGQYVDLKLGADEDGREPTNGPECDPCLADGIWTLDWHVPAAHPEGITYLRVDGQWCDDLGFCWTFPIAFTHVYVDPTPPLPVILAPAHESKNAPLVLFSALVPDENVIDSSWGVAPLAFQEGKGLTGLDQHVAGATLSTGGKMSCFPTATASSLMWFNDHGHGGITPAGGANEPVEKLGKLAGTSDAGTTSAGMESAVKKYLKSVGKGQDFNVRTLQNPTLKKIQEEFGKGEDIVLDIAWTQGGAHAVTVEQIGDADKEGTRDVKVMDPDDGGFKTYKVTKDGSVYCPACGTKLGKIRSALDVSPREKADLKDVPKFRSGFNDLDRNTHNAVWNALGEPNGWYLAQVTATDATGITMSASAVFFMDP